MTGKVIPIPRARRPSLTPFVTNAWYVAAWAGELGPECPLARTVTGVPLALWRDADGRPAAFQARLGGMTGHVDRWMIHTLTLPGLLVLDTGAAPAGTGAPQGARIGAFETRGVQAITPETATTTHYFFTQPHPIVDARRDEVSDAIHATLLRAFEEDRRVLEAQQRTLAADPGFVPVPIAADAGLQHLRRIRDRRLADEHAARVRTTTGT
jgi:phenylpropionate dioxygenase-like ring-hydroxylating dioxygenase large terminal subunit